MPVAPASGVPPPCGLSWLSTDLLPASTAGHSRLRFSGALLLPIFHTPTSAQNLCTYSSKDPALSPGSLLPVDYCSAAPAVSIPARLPLAADTAAIAASPAAHLFPAVPQPLSVSSAFLPPFASLPAGSILFCSSLVGPFLVLRRGHFNFAERGLYYFALTFKQKYLDRIPSPGKITPNV